MIGNHIQEIQRLKIFLHSEFTIKNLGETDYLLGIQIVLLKQGIVVSQQKYILDILQETNLVDAKPSELPFPLGVKSLLKMELY